MAIEVLIVGPSSRTTGGIARYVTEQQKHLSGRIHPTVYDIGISTDGVLPKFVDGVIASFLDMLLFPFRARPEALHVHTSHGFAFYRASFYVLFGAVVWRRPVVLHIHGSSFDEFVDAEAGVLRAFQSVVFEACESIIVLSDYWREVMARRVDESKLEVHPNAVDVDDYDPSFETEVPTISFVSNLVKRKGILDLVEAIERLEHDNVGPFRVRIAGDGPQAERARDLAERFDEVEYLGYVTEAEKRELLETSSIYVLPAYAEGLPIALLEGMVGGNAVVATDVGSIPEVITEAGGVLISPGDVDRLTETLRTLIDQPERVRDMARWNHQTVGENYAWGTLSGELDDLYATVVEF